ncbi:MAG: hypothetical protein VX112_00675 [Pseudomonadota bacterium]|nr:hypothetical protein [Pseudomonadota bacterium]
MLEEQKKHSKPSKDAQENITVESLNAELLRHAIACIDCVDSLGFQDGLAKLQGSHTKWKQSLSDDIAVFLDFATILESGRLGSSILPVFEAIMSLWLGCKRAQAFSQGNFLKQVPMAERLMRHLDEVTKLNVSAIIQLGPLSVVTQPESQSAAQDQDSNTTDTTVSTESVEQSQMTEGNLNQDETLDQIEKGKSSFDIIPPQRELNGVLSQGNSIHASSVSSGATDSLLQTEQMLKQTPAPLSSTSESAEAAVDEKSQLDQELDQETMKIPAPEQTENDLHSLLTQLDMQYHDNLQEDTQKRFQQIILKAREDAKNNYAQASIHEMVVHGFLAELTILRLRVAIYGSRGTKNLDNQGDLNKSIHAIDTQLASFLESIREIQGDSHSVLPKRSHKKPKQILSQHSIAAFLQSVSLTLAKPQSAQQPMVNRSGSTLPAISDDD